MTELVEALKARGAALMTARLSLAQLNRSNRGILHTLYVYDELQNKKTPNTTRRDTEKCSVNVALKPVKETKVVSISGRGQCVLKVHGASHTQLTFPDVVPGTLEVPDHVWRTAKDVGTMLLENADRSKRQYHLILGNAVYKYCAIVARYFEKGCIGHIEYGVPGRRMTMRGLHENKYSDFAQRQPEPFASALQQATIYFEPQLTAAGLDVAHKALRYAVQSMRVYLVHKRDRAHLKHHVRPHESSLDESDVAEDEIHAGQDSDTPSADWLFAGAQSSSTKPNVCMVSMAKSNKNGNEY